MKKMPIPEGKYPVIKIIFDNPQSGYWDGQIREAVFKPEIYYANLSILGNHVHPGEKGEIKWGSWGANYWFFCKAGKDWNDAINKALRKLKVGRNIKCHYEIEWRDNKSNGWK